jgi:hypothetical protein
MVPGTGLRAPWGRGGPFQMFTGIRLEVPSRVGYVVPMARSFHGWGVIGGKPNQDDPTEGTTVFGYADETSFVPQGGGRRRVGSGILLTRAKIGPDLIQEAMERLRSNPEVTREDDRTAKRGCFHASKDSRAARRAFAQAIRATVSGTVLYSYRDPEVCPPLEPKNTEGSHQNLAFLLSLLPVTSTRSQVEILVEDRLGLGPIEQPAWMERLYRNIELRVCDTPSIPALFPDMRISKGDKTEPGLQVVDLLLWALNRSEAVQIDSGSGLDRASILADLGLTPAYGHRAGNASTRGGVYYIGNEVPTVFISYTAGLPVPETMGWDGAFRAWALIEETLRNAYERGLPSHASHLREPLAHVVQRLSDPNPMPEDKVIASAASMFIRLFDTVPLHDGIPPSSEDQWALILFARRIASLVQRWDLVHGVTCLHAVLKWRREALQHDR